MPTSLDDKSSIETIKARFDDDVERFSKLETGQQSTMDAPLMMELITGAAVHNNPTAKRILDIGCGAGNNTLKLLQQINPLDCDLVDLSEPMLKRASKRVNEINNGKVETFQGDFRSVPLPGESYDIIIAAAVLHHLRDEADWRQAFQKIYDITAPGGSVWISDLIAHDNEQVQEIMWKRFGKHLKSLGGADYRDKVFAYVDEEDSPRALIFQLDLFRSVGFSQVEILHKNACFAAFGAIKTK